MTQVTLADEVLPAAYVLLETGGDTLRLEVTGEQYTATAADDQTWTCTALIGPGHPTFTVQRGDRFYIHDELDQVIGTSQLRLTYPLLFTPLDSLSLTYTQRVIR